MAEASLLSFPSHRAPRTLFFFLPSHPTTQRGLCGGESHCLFKALIKRKIVTSRECCTRRFVCEISSCFAKKMLSKIRIFLALIVSLSEKNLQSNFVKIFQVLADEEMVKVNLSSFQLKTLFKFVLA